MADTVTSDSNRVDILDRLTEVFRDVFDDEAIEIGESTTAANIPEWDSLMHITLCVAIEGEFKIRLNAVEVASLANVGEMMGLILKRME